MEGDLTFDGTTAVEDRLQDGVPATLRALERAGVRVWIMTGDKLETAPNIGLSCGLLNVDMDIIVLTEADLEGTIAQIDRALGRWSALLADGWQPQQFGLVIDGGTLHWALLLELQHKLMLLGRSARSLIACRVSPKQKTEMVELIRRLDAGKVTLAIGDGANDVGMIPAAHVGVGLVGLEGKEAELASDLPLGSSASSHASCLYTPAGTTRASRGWYCLSSTRTLCSFCVSCFGRPTRPLRGSHCLTRGLGPCAT